MKYKIVIILKGSAIIAAAFLLNACQFGRYVYYNFADIGDHKIFPSRPLQAPAEAFRFQKTENGKAPKYITNENGKEVSFKQYLQESKTVAFLIIKNDTVQYEQYLNGYSEQSIVPSFSMAKSITSILIGCAIDDGFIQSIDEPVTKYLPEMGKSGFDKVTIKHLLQMTSGLKFNESYVNPFGHAASFYYGKNLKKASHKLKLQHEPGKKFSYVSGNTQLLGLVLAQAVKGKTITQYLQEKIWTPLGMEYDASWSLDSKKHGVEKSFCCVNARARDFAKLGRLYLNKGNWNGKQIVSAKWVEESTKIDTEAGSAPFYQYQWWLPTKNGDFMAEGILGQIVYVNPKSNLVIVRLGKKGGKVNWGKFSASLASNYR